MSDSQKPFDIYGSFADPSNFDTGAAKLTNVRVVARSPGEGRPAKLRLVGTPGLTLFAQPENTNLLTLQAGQATGFLDTLYAIYSSGNLYGSSPPGVPVGSLGTVDFGGAAIPIVRTAEMKSQLLICTNAQDFKGGSNGYGGKYYVGGIGIGAVFQDLPTSLNFSPSSVCVLDNIGVLGGSGNDFAFNQDFHMYCTAPGDGTTISASAFAAKEGRVDPLLDVVTTMRNFFAFGERSTELWYDAGSSADFPFQPFTNFLLDVGLANRRTLAHVHGKVMWLGTDNRIWLGYQQSANPISPAWLDLELQRLQNTGNIQQLTAFMYSQGGDEFYCLTREGVWSMEMALSTGIWNYVKSPGRPDSARRCAYEFRNGQTYIGLDTGHICLLDNTVATEPGGTLTREIISPWVGELVNRHVGDALTATSSLGPAAGQFQFSWSEDGFNTVRGLRNITFGQPGTSRAIARQLGSSRRRQFRLQYSGAAAPFEFDELFGEVTGGS